MRRAAVITSSDSGSRGEREDISGQVICEILEREGYQVVYRNPASGRKRASGGGDGQDR